MSETRTRSDDRMAVTVAAQERQRDWFRDFRSRVIERGEPYVIAPAVAPHEIFHAMDVPVVSTQWYAAVIAAKQLSPYYFETMERRGFHDGLPRYDSLPFISTLDNDPERAPYGGLPKPALILDRARGEYSQRIYEQWAAAYGVPSFLLDSPSQTRLPPRWFEESQRNWEELYEPHRLDFQVEQLEALIRMAETLTGRPFQHSVFTRQMHLINRLGEVIADIRDRIAAARPLPVSLNEQLTNVMACTWHRGSEWALAHAERYRDEVVQRIENGAGVCADERVRLLWLNNGLWFNTGFYRAFEEQFGAVFVWSMYTNFLSDGYRKYFTDDPLRALAARHISMNEQLHLPPWMAEWILKQAEDFGAHGAVMLVPQGDRLSAYGTRLARIALEEAGLPVLELHASMVDARLWDDARMKAMVEEFIATRVRRP